MVKCRELVSKHEKRSCPLLVSMAVNISVSLNRQQQGEDSLELSFNTLSFLPFQTSKNSLKRHLL